LLKVQALPVVTGDDVMQRIAELPFPPNLAPGMTIDGYEILRELHLSKRSEVFLALDKDNGQKVVLKTPSSNFADDPEYLDAFLHEEWVGRRVQSAHLLKIQQPQRRQFLYNITEYVEGQSLASWLADNGRASLSQMREFARQLVSGLRAMHRQEMFHQDLKPENVLIDDNGTLKLIDFGSTHIAGISEIDRQYLGNVAQGTLSYAAPECIQGEAGTKPSDLYSLGVIVYELLTGELPYGEFDRPEALVRRSYTPAFEHNPEIPRWVDAAIAKAVQPDPRRRYDSLSEFLFDLSRPNPGFNLGEPQPLIKSNPVAFWRGLSVLLFGLLIALLATS
jgi:serine/threonine protein kinase